MSQGKTEPNQHNDANVCVIGVDCAGIKLSTALAMEYLRAEFDHEERNMIRIQLMKDFDNVLHK